MIKTLIETMIQIIFKLCSNISIGSVDVNNKIKDKNILI